MNDAERAAYFCLKVIWYIIIGIGVIYGLSFFFYVWYKIITHVDAFSAVVTTLFALLMLPPMIFNIIALFKS